jgi:hypothetical protein
MGHTTEVHLAVYTPLRQLKHSAKCSVQGTWPTEALIRIIDCRHIHQLVGIWASPLSDRVYVLRKHPGLGMLTEGEKGSDEANQEDSIDGIERESY